MTPRAADAGLPGFAAGAAIPARPGGVIGPNAIVRVAEALLSRAGQSKRDAVFARAGLTQHLAQPPERMVAEHDVARLQRALHDLLGARDAADISREAGRLTANYLLACRIPRAAQSLLRILPRPLAARLLTRAIAKHAWTFAGSGRFTYTFGRTLELRLQGGPVCRLLRSTEPVCDYYAATFQGVFAAILGPTLQVTEIACEAAGAPACVFQVRWGS